MTTQPVLQPEHKSPSPTQTAFDQLRRELENCIIGQQTLVEHLLIALLADGHLLVEGAPGLAKTTAVKELARRIEGDFHRLQFTPDLLPGDLTGPEIYRPQTGGFEFQQGPIFHNLILADEINRAPAKVQSALLEAMGERQITVGQITYTLPRLFLVMATQNPIEQEGTYPLPEAQLDRFMFNVVVGYPSREDEVEILRRTTQVVTEDLPEIMSGEEILRCQALVRRVPIADDMLQYAAELVRSTRPDQENVPGFVRENLKWGAGPRAGQYLVLGAKTRAVIRGRFHVSMEDIQRVARPVLRHRILTNYSAQAEGIQADDIIDRLLDTVPLHPTQNVNDGGLPEVVGSTDH